MAEEYRGYWPAGWREDGGGQLGFPIRGIGTAPVWACPLCRTAQLHTLAEHEKILGLAERR